MLPRDFTTRADLREHLEREAVEEPAKGLILSVTARFRHQWRIERALAAAYETAARRLNVTVEEVREHWSYQAAALLAAELYDLSYTAATTRLEAFRGLGKGRRQASDGSAYTAAIEAALAGLIREGCWSPGEPPNGPVFACTLADGTAADTVSEHLLSVSEREMIAAHSLAHVCGVPPLWWPAPYVTVGGHLADWARLLNFLRSSMDESFYGQM